MCEQLHVLITQESIWLCSPTVSCPVHITPPRRVNITTNATEIIRNELVVKNFNSTNSTMNNRSTTVLNVPTNTTIKNSTYTNVTDTNSTYNTTHTTKIPLAAPTPAPSPEKARDNTVPHAPQSVTVYLRHQTNQSNTTNLQISCKCDTSQWLHTLWGLPVLVIFLLFLYSKCQKKRHKISNIFIPNNSHTLTRAASWPQLIQSAPQLIEPASEPGDISTRGIFLTGIL